MNQSHPPVRKLKGSTAYTWDSERTGERVSSQFAPSSQHSSGLSGYSSFEVRRVRPRPRSEGLRTLWAALALVALVAGAGLWSLVHWLHR